MIFTHGHLSLLPSPSILLIKGYQQHITQDQSVSLLCKGECTLGEPRGVSKGEDASRLSGLLEVMEWMVSAGAGEDKCPHFWMRALLGTALTRTRLSREFLLGRFMGGLTSKQTSCSCQRSLCWNCL